MHVCRTQNFGPALLCIVRLLLLAGTCWPPLRRLLSPAGPLAVWVVANLHYSRVLKQIAPLEGQLNQLTGELKESQDRLQQCQAELMALDEQVGCPVIKSRTGFIPARSTCTVGCRPV